MRSAFYLSVFPNFMFTPFFIWKGYVLSGEIALKITIIIIIMKLTHMHALMTVTIYAYIYIKLTCIYISL